MRGPDDGAWPVFVTDHLTALLAQDPIHAETHDRPEVSEQDAGTGLNRHAPTFPRDRRNGQRLRGSLSGKPARSLAAEHQVDTRAGDFELRAGLATVRRASEQPVLARRQAVEAE